MKHLGTIELHTPRLLLRRYTPEDAVEVYKNWATDPLTSKFLSWNVHESVEETRDIVGRWVESYEDPAVYHWVLQYGDTLIGAISLHDISLKNERVEVGYCMGSKWWNQGLMTEALAAVIRFCFDELECHKVCGRFDTENIGSGRVMQKCGMQPEGILCQDYKRKDGSFGDMAMYGIVRE
ncbi:MAG: GNAT family N-acetyltransferase [Firmicutes bacterium]|nr:GNAT family N-acetyltransferase [Bacillota bacterium]